MIYLIIAAGIVLLFLFRKNYFFQCPNCGHKQRKYHILRKDNQTVMTHGRTTLSGRSDKRYNSRYDTNTIVTYGVECAGCGICYSNRNGLVNEINPKEFSENAPDKKWLYILYEESDMLGEHYKHLQKDKTELLKGENIELIKKYGFRNNLEIKRVLQLIDRINKNLKESCKRGSTADNLRIQKKIMENIGAGTSHLDEYAEKYGIVIPKTKYVSNPETTEFLTLLKSLSANKI